MLSRRVYVFSTFLAMRVFFVLNSLQNGMSLVSMSRHIETYHAHTWETGEVNNLRVEPLF